MITITLTELKNHLRLNSGTSEDAELTGYGDAAEDTFKNLTGRTLDTNATTGFPSGYPAVVKLAVLLLAGHFYRVREAYTDQQVSEMPFGFISVCRQFSTKFVSPGAV